MKTTMMQAIMAAAVSAAGVADALAQNPAAQAAQLFAASADVTALIARARSERKPDQAIFVQPIVRLAPFTANLEYRVESVAAPASTHEGDAEMFFVIEGGGTIVTGGTLRDGRRTNAANLTGSAIDGGQSRRITRGDWVIVPENTPHWFTKVEGTLVMMSLHLPRAATSR